ncbi:hypothetical protein BTUL_0139g00300 [Botrytis tulipae]|uniref:Uncharacterized protein n=1 Tax=Botrytis tulipae TaxID=87230 RepID=A0A4Z1EIV3_9HELO|nr:hypothetical protein BTUL_0139g00300 [Botrytis tulipae]
MTTEWLFRIPLFSLLQLIFVVSSRNLSFFYHPNSILPRLKLRKQTTTTMEARIAAFIVTRGVPNETASVMFSKYANDENLATLLSKTTTEKRSIPELTPLACWTAKLLFGTDAEYTTVNKSLIEVRSLSTTSTMCNFSQFSRRNSLAIKIIPFLYVPFAVRSGGYSPNLLGQASALTES